MGLQHLLPGVGKWTRQSVPDLTGKVAVVSGFNSGIGFETTRTLLEHNAEVSNARGGTPPVLEVLSTIGQSVPARAWPLGSLQLGLQCASQ